MFCLFVIFSKIGLVCGVPDLNPTMLRVAAETQIQKNSDMKKTAKIINMHSEDVGRLVYHKNGPRIRAEFANFMDVNVDSPAKKIKLTDEVDIEKERKMQALEEADAEKRKQDAEAYLESEREKRKRSLPIGKRRRLTAQQKEFLQELVFKELFNSTYQDFPDGKLLYSNSKS